MESLSERIAIMAWEDLLEAAGWDEETAPLPSPRAENAQTANFSGSHDNPSSDGGAM